MADSSVLGRGTAAGVINLGKGHPNEELLELPALAKAFERAAARPGARVRMMQYGPGEGNEAMLRAIRGAFEPDAEDGALLVTNGSGQGLDLVCSLFARRGDVIVVDSPAYFLAFFTFRDHGLEIVDARTDELGLDVDALEAALPNMPRPPALLYTVPIANNPTGASMPEERMRKLVALAQNYGFKVVVDEVYRFLTYPPDAPPPRSVRAFDTDAENPVVFSLNSFAKLLGPGMRLGWLHAHPKYIQRVLAGGLVLSGGGLNPFTSEIVAELIASGEQARIIARLREVYTRNMEVMASAIERYVRPVCPGVHYAKPTGGFFFWLRLPPQSVADTWELNEHAQLQHGVSFFPGAKFASRGRGTELDACLRMCFAYLTADDIDQGVKRLAAAIASSPSRTP